MPLVTHNEVIEWDYIKEFTGIYKEINEIILKENFRISAHPDHYTILASPDEKVINSSIKDLVYHNNIMNAIGLNVDYGKLILHIGGRYKNKKDTIKRFKKNFLTLHSSIRDRLVLENDDKIYDVIDVLELCEELDIPMALDVHHYWCNNRGERLGDYLERIFNTWNNQLLIPKVHLSSPKSERNFRAHADDIDFDFFYEFAKIAKKIGRDIDIMIEAKNKNIALFNLMKKIKESNKFKILDEASIEI